MAALELNIVDEILDEIEVSDTISISSLERKTIWHMNVPDQGVYSFVITEKEYDALKLPERVALKKAARSIERTKMFILEGPIRGKIMPLSVKAFRGYPTLCTIFAENMEQAELKLFPKIAATVEVVGAGVIISAFPRERFETVENLIIKVEAIEETIAEAEREGDRETIRALKRAVRMGERRLSAITRGKEKKNEDGQVSLF